MASTQVKISVPGNHLMIPLLGERDELLGESRQAGSGANPSDAVVHVHMAAGQHVAAGQQGEHPSRQARLRGASGRAAQPV